MLNRTGPWYNNDDELEKDINELFMIPDDQAEDSDMNGDSDADDSFHPWTTTNSSIVSTDEAVDSPTSGVDNPQPMDQGNIVISQLETSLNLSLTTFGK